MYHKVRNELESCREECRVLKERLTSCEENAELEKKWRLVFFFLSLRRVFVVSRLIIVKFVQTLLL
jgi:hypothetical protein